MRWGVVSGMGKAWEERESVGWDGWGRERREKVENEKKRVR